MVQIRKWSAQTEHKGQKLTVHFEAPFFDEFTNPVGFLTAHFECQALWDYYGNALISHSKAQRNLVYEDDLSIKFDQETARNLFRSIAQKHGVRPEDMINFWPHVERQRIGMGGKDQLPEEFKFRIWSH